MTEPLIFVSHELVHFNVFRYDTWVDLKYFAIQPAAPDDVLLASLIGHEQYHDHYAGEDPTEQTHHSLHGPYRLEAVTPRSFKVVSAESARKELMEWMTSWVVQEEDGPEVEAMLSAEVLPELDAGSIFRLPDLRESAEHEWGWVVGQTGFHEIVKIDRAAGLLTLLVASDD